MSSAKVQINELRLRAPGLTPDHARYLGELVAQRLSNTPLVAEQSRQIPSQNVQLRANKGAPIDRMADEIVAGIRRSLK
jgi:hypothetical protein